MYAIPGVVCHPWGRMLHLHHLILPLLCLALTVTLTILYDSRHRLLLLLLRFLFLLRDLIVNNSSSSRQACWDSPTCQSQIVG